MMRKPQRVSATLNWQLHQRLQDRADLEGRSLSNLVSYLLEAANME
jgi:macrodomain Ter protein organizer (MatP/YcbG family)